LRVSLDLAAPVCNARASFLRGSRFMGFDIETRIRNVTAVLGPTNTGKTHLAIERMLGHETGMIGLPLRLLAREVYDRIASRIGADKVALVTGEEKIRPENARYWVSTVEAMPREIDVDFLAIDEIQLAADPERGHVFTDRLLHARGKLETLLLGAQTMRDAISDLVPGCNFITRPRLSKLTYTGQKKITRLPGRTAVVAFSAGEVYAIAELIRRQQGGAAVVLGALSPRTRNAQVALYQSGDVDFLVATDAIGMGLNLDVDHVAFAATRKFDGQNHRQLTPAELAQIAGRAGRYMNDGTFGVTGDVEPFEHDVVERLESHTFDPIKMLQWRARSLDFSSLYNLRESLRQAPREQRLVKARMADDVEALEAVSTDNEVARMASGPAAVSMLWDVCQIPDYRKISSQNHAELVSTVYRFLRGPDERIPEDWLAKQIEQSDRTDGDIDTLATRIAHIRTWTFVSNRGHWLKDPAHWQARTREIEDALSDALHEQLTQRFVDRRTSALMKGLRAKEELAADIGDDGAIHVESHFVGRLKGFRFLPDTSPVEGIHAKAARHAAAQVLAKELAMRVRRVTSAKNDAFKLSRTGRIVWREQEIARVEAGADGLKPQIAVIADDHLQVADREKVHERLVGWLAESVSDKLQPLAEIAKAEDISGLAKGIAFRLVENFGSLKREAVAEEIKTLDQPARSQLRKYGVRFGAFNIFFPPILKPASADLTLALWLSKHGAESGLDMDNLPEPPRPGLTSVTANPAIPEAFYRACGYHLCGPRAVRMDILERLADMVRPLIAFRSKDNEGRTPPRGSTGDGGFLVMPEMMSVLGASGEELANVLKSLGFWVERRPKRIVAPKAEPAHTAAGQPAAQPATAEATAGEPAATGQVDAPAASLETVSPLSPEPSIPPTETPEPEAVVAQPTDPAASEAVAISDAAVSEDGAVPSTDSAPSGEQAGEDAAASAAAPEPPVVEMEEVWRPRRHRREDRRPGEHRGEHRQGERPGQHRGSGKWRSEGQRHGRGASQERPHGGPPRAATDVATSTTSPDTLATASTETAPTPPEHDRHGDRHRHGQGQHRQGGQGKHQGNRQGQGHGQGQGKAPGHQGHRQDAQGRGPGGPKGGGFRGGGPREGGHRDGKHRDRGAGTWSTQTKQPKQTVDPDSPFAKLSALKAELEKRGSS
jgi:ATP-dependent RNA helicase SUPV3L1/SUV3